MRDSCGRCVWYDRDTRECRRRPPAVVVVSNAPRSRFPKVARDDWCGDYLGHAGAVEVTDE